MRLKLYSSFFLFVVLLVVPLTSFSQIPFPSQQDPSFPDAKRPTQLPGDPQNDEGERDRQRRAKFEKDAEKKANQARQAQLKQETEKLLRLSTELKEYVDKTSENVLSVDVIKKADEIEKLAHSVKDKMKGN